MSNIKLTPAQKDVIRRMREGGFVIVLLDYAFWGGGCGDRVNKNTIVSLKKRGIIDWRNQLTTLGRTISID